MSLLSALTLLVVPWLAIAAPAAVAVAAVAANTPPPLELQLDEETGAFTVAVGGQLWFSSAEYRVGALSSSGLSGGGLRLVSTLQRGGSDPLGSYTARELNWAHEASPEKVMMTTSVRRYISDPSMLVFEQAFPNEVDLKHWTEGQSLAAGTLFPSFARGGSAPDLDCFSYHGTFAYVKGCTLGSYAASEQGGVPLVVYNASDARLPMVVLSPLSSPMAQQMAQGEGFLGVGVKATVETIPAGWSQLFLMSAGSGINDGMMAWGDRMLKFSGKPRVDNRYKDDVHGTIGYWTDNGGYYHYSIGNNKSLGSNYEEVLVKVKEYHDSLGMPFRHWQLDSWFYPKDGTVDPGGGGGAVTNWTALPSVFPHGLSYFQSKIGLPMVMHNRQWSPRSDYIHNWTDIEWYTSKDIAMPKDPVKFFRRFFKQQEGWGLAMYEQDWMVTQYEKTEALHTNISLSDLWLHGMADGAASSGRTVQYCMPLPGQVLSGSAHSAVTNVRASDDYFHRMDQWAIGNTALFYWALNILPFKDGFYSSAERQVGGQTEGPEPNPDREALMATLSCAMVGPMDGIYLLNASRVLATCRGDGVVLKPDRPLTATDACFRARRPGCQVYQTSSDLRGLGRVHYYFNNDGGSPLRAEEVYVRPEEQEHVVLNWYTGDLARLQDSNQLTAGYEGHVYALVTPLRSGWALLGETGKYVPTSVLRFPSVTVAADGGSLVAEVHGVKGETLEVCAARVLASGGFRRMCEEVSFETEESKVLRFAAQEQIVV